MQNAATYELTSKMKAEEHGWKYRISAKRRIGAGEEEKRDDGLTRQGRGSVQSQLRLNWVDAGGE